MDGGSEVEEEQNITCEEFPNDRCGPRNQSDTNEQYDEDRRRTRQPDDGAMTVNSTGELRAIPMMIFIPIITDAHTYDKVTLDVLGKGTTSFPDATKGIEFITRLVKEAGSARVNRENNPSGGSLKRNSDVLALTPPMEAETNCGGGTPLAIASLESTMMVGEQRVKRRKKEEGAHSILITANTTQIHRARRPKFIQEIYCNTRMLSEKEHEHCKRYMERRMSSQIDEMSKKCWLCCNIMRGGMIPKRVVFKCGQDNASHTRHICIYCSRDLKANNVNCVIPTCVKGNV